MASPRHILGQAVGIDITHYVILYQVPTNATDAVISQVMIANTTGSGVTFSLAACRMDATLVATLLTPPAVTFLYKISVLAANTTLPFAKGVTLGPGEFLIGAGSVAGVVFNVFGQENLA